MQEEKRELNTTTKKMRCAHRLSYSFEAPANKCPLPQCQIEYSFTSGATQPFNGAGCIFFALCCSMHNTLVEKAKMHSCVVSHLTHKVYVNYKRSAQDTSVSGTVLNRAPVAVSATFTLVVVVGGGGGSK